MLKEGAVIVNLTQNCDFMNYSGSQCPCLLTKSYMWSLRLNRPLLWQEQMTAQGVPQFEPFLEASGVYDCQIRSNLGHTAMTKMAGNGFQIASAGSFVGFVLCMLEKRSHPFEA